MNIHVMNATQLAVYFIASYPKATPDEVNAAVEEFVHERAKTEFGLSPEHVGEFIQRHFGHYGESKVSHDGSHDEDENPKTTLRKARA